jgi:hypothetical protein
MGLYKGDTYRYEVSPSTDGASERMPCESLEEAALCSARSTRAKQSTAVGATKGGADVAPTSTAAADEALELAPPLSEAADRDKAHEAEAKAGTEQKAEAVRRWTPVVQQQFRETCVRLVRFREVIDVDCPKAMAQLERMLKALDAYRQVASPTGDATGDGGGGGQTVTRQLDDSAAATPPAASASAPPTAGPEGTAS